MTVWLSIGAGSRRWQKLAEARRCLSRCREIQVGLGADEVVDGDGNQPVSAAVRSASVSVAASSSKLAQI